MVGSALLEAGYARVCSRFQRGEGGARFCAQQGASNRLESQVLI